MKYLFLIFSVVCLSSCMNEQQEKPLETLDKKSAREVTLKTVTQGDTVLHITTQYIWFNGEQIASQSDTIKTPVIPKSWDAADTSNTLSKVPIYVTVQ